MDACPREFFGGGKSKKLVVAQMVCWNTTTGQSLAGTSSLRSSTRATLPSVLVGVQSLCQVCTQSCWVALSGRGTNNTTSFATRPSCLFFLCQPGTVQRASCPLLVLLLVRACCFVRERRSQITQDTPTPLPSLAWPLPSGGRTLTPTCVTAQVVLPGSHLVRIIVWCCFSRNSRANA